MKLDINTLKLAPMQMADLDQVLIIENQAHSHPWSRGNFIDSLAQQHEAWVVHSVDGGILGYFVLMRAADEAQLLTIAVKNTIQGKGIGHFLLRQVIDRAKAMHLAAMVLEVRVSNARAVRLYEAMGFELVGCRKNYYETNSRQREDALIFRYDML